ncbi:hypothetical protein WJX74_004490 [Apatococcus lobatus]|uniref:Uncharacterized protein n=2 Tax=Apatococcus TaxID=904362 RepID=A0AAW1SWV0_9CHLO
MNQQQYSVPRTELLAWINNTLSLHVTKIEQTASGAVACQFLDALHPGSVAINKVDFNAKHDYEFIHNYKVLQAAFNKLGIDKTVEVNRLIKARPLDNMEFMQWFKAYWDSHNGDRIDTYDAMGRRAASKTGDVRSSREGSTRMTGDSSRPSTSSAASSSGRMGGAAPMRSRSGTSGANGAVGAAGQSRTMNGPSANGVRRTMNGATSLGAQRGANAPPTPPRSVNGASTVEDEGLANQVAQVAALTEQVTELKLKVDTAERERDFYFDKLRDIEILCQNPALQAIPIVKTFEAILYAADEREAKAAMAAVQETQEKGTRGSFEGIDIASESLDGLNLQQPPALPS